MWVSLNMLVDVNTDFKKLHPHTGQVSDMYVVITRIINKPLYKDTTRELRIALMGEPQYFTLSSKSTFDDITTTVHKGDTVTIYTKEKALGLLGFGNEHSIAHLVKHPIKQVLVDFNEKQQYYNSFFWLPILITAGSLIWYIIKVRKRLWWELGGYRTP